MKLSVLDIEKFVKVNGLKQVTSMTFFEGTGFPTESGLFSHSIFGRPGSTERRTRWAYIDLGGTFMHPMIYKACTQLDRKFQAIVSGERMVSLTASGLIRDVPEGETGGWTGMDAIRSNWDKISWGPSEAGSQRSERTRLLKIVPKELAFISKWPVMPAIYREAMASGRGGTMDVPPINYLYVQLMAKSPTVVSGISFADGARKLRAQELLLELHISTLDLIQGKRGLIQERVLGKYTDFATRGVLSGPPLAKADHPGDQEVPFGHLGVPLYLLVNMFQPFIIKWLDEKLGPLARGQERILVGKSSAGATAVSKADQEILRQSKEVRQKVLPVIERERAQLLKRYGLKDAHPAGSMTSGTNLPGDMSDLDFNVPVSDVAAESKRLEGMGLPKTKDNGTYVTHTYKTPEGMDVDVKLRPPHEVEYVRRGLERVLKLPQAERDRMILEKYKLKNGKDKAAYDRWKVETYSRLGTIPPGGSWEDVEAIKASLKEKEPIAVPAEKSQYLELPAEARARLGPDLYREWISRFMHSQSARLDPVTIRAGKKGEPVRVPLYDADLGRPTTLLDLFYVAASDVTSDKYVMFTRYPVEDFRACHFARASILTTERTVEKRIGDRTYKRYPETGPPVRWVDSYRISNSYTKAMGADLNH